MRFAPHKRDLTAKTKPAARLAAGPGTDELTTLAALAMRTGDLSVAWGFLDGIAPLVPGVCRAIRGSAGGQDVRRK